MFRQRRRVPIKFIMLLFLIGTIGSMIFIDRMIQPVIFTIAKAKAINIATEKLNKAVQDRLAKENVRYEDIVHIQKDSQGKIVMVQTDTMKINQISTEMTLKIQDSLKNLGDEEIGIPIGQLLGIRILAALGPEFSVHLIPVGTVRVDIIDKFEGAGINQTRHLIWLDLNSDFQIAVPLYSETLKVNTKVPLAENIIVGDVPTGMLLTHPLP